jgi:hypothetical protein
MRELRMVIARQPTAVRIAVEKHLDLPQFTAVPEVPAWMPAVTAQQPE